MQCNGLPPSINDLLNAMGQLRRRGEYPLSQFKIHPDDYMELKRQASPSLPHPMPGVPDSFYGMKIVVDASAERLPRRMP